MVVRDGGEVAAAPPAMPPALLLSLSLGRRHGGGAVAQKLPAKQPREGKHTGSGDEGSRMPGLDNKGKTELGKYMRGGGVAQKDVILILKSVKYGLYD
jgi:hypothetical protein